jgi:hypothetical protein
VRLIGKVCSKLAPERGEPGLVIEWPGCCIPLGRHSRAFAPTVVHWPQRICAASARMIDDATEMLFVRVHAADFRRLTLIQASSSGVISLYVRPIFLHSRSRYRREHRIERTQETEYNIHSIKLSWESGRRCYAPRQIVLLKGLLRLDQTEMMQDLS